MRHRPPTIEEIGLPEYMHARVKEHNGYDYEDLDGWMKRGVNATNIAKLLGCSVPKASRLMSVWNKNNTKGSSNG
jgi:hypothetical protein